RPLRQARQQAVVVGVRDVINRVVKNAKSIRIRQPRLRVQNAGGGSEHDGVSVLERRELMGGISGIAYFRHEAIRQLSLHTQVVLVDIRRAQMWIDRYPSGPEFVVKSDVRSRGNGRERVGGAGGHIRLAQVVIR